MYFNKLSSKVEQLAKEAGVTDDLKRKWFLMICFMTIDNYTECQALSEDEIIRQAFEIENNNGNYTGLTVDEFEKQVTERAFR